MYCSLASIRKTHPPCTERAGHHGDLENTAKSRPTEHSPHKQCVEIGLTRRRHRVPLLDTAIGTLKAEQALWDKSLPRMSSTNPFPPPHTCPGPYTTTIPRLQPVISKELLWQGMMPSYRRRARESLRIQPFSGRHQAHTRVGDQKTRKTLKAKKDNYPRSARGRV
jgi:hypothetical protein